MTTAAMSPFRQKAETSSAEDFELPPAGFHPATLIALIDLGTHDDEYNGKINTFRKIYVVWELANEHDSEGKPFLVGQDYTWSLKGDKAKWRLMIEGWRGRAFADNEEFDPLVLLGKPCNITLKEGETKASKKKFVKVVAVAAPMKGQTIGKPTNPEFAWHLSTWGDPKVDPPIPEWCPLNYGRLVIADIKSSKEWASMGGQAHPAEATKSAPAANGQAATQATAPVEKEDPPF